MKRVFLFLFMCIAMNFQMGAQDEGFSLKVNKDTILAGNVLQLSFVANNVAGKFEAPDFEGLNVISGPNTSTAMSMINGEVSQKATYSFGILTEEIGEVMVPPAFLVTSDGTLETEPQSIIVLPNPEGIIEQPPTQSGYFQFGFPELNVPQKKEKEDSKSKKKKRKLKKF